MSTSSDMTSAIGHEPSPEPDERALFSRLAASMAKHRRAVILHLARGHRGGCAVGDHVDEGAVGCRMGGEGLDRRAGADELRRDFPALGAESPIVVYRQDTPIADDPAGLRALEAELIGGPARGAVADPLAMPPRPG